jgi:hypothetical protein
MSEQDAKQWILDLLDVMLRGAKLTPTVIDDRAVELSIMAMQNPIIWGWAWTVLRPVLEEGEDRVMAVASCPPEVEAESDKVEIDPLTIIAIINAVLELIKIWRNRRQ